MLELLARAGATATFFVIGEQVRRRPELAGARSRPRATRSRCTAIATGCSCGLGPDAAARRPARGAAAIEDATVLAPAGIARRTGSTAPRGWRRARGRAAAAAVVAVGQGLAQVHHPGADRRASDRGLLPRRRDFPARCGLLQLARLAPRGPPRRSRSSCGELERRKSVPSCLSDTLARAHTRWQDRQAGAGDRRRRPAERRATPRRSHNHESAHHRLRNRARLTSRGSRSGSIERDRARLHELIDEVLDSNRWSEGDDDRALRGRLGGSGTALPAVAFSSWAGGALAALEFAGVRGETVLCPSNTFMATPLAAIRAGARCSSSTATARTCACRSPTSSATAERYRPRAAFLVHIGGHIAFDVEQIAALLPRARDLPDRGLRPRPRRRAGTAQARAPGATPASTRCTRRRRSRPARAACSSRAGPRSIEHAREFRNYGKPELRGRRASTSG